MFCKEYEHLATVYDANGEVDYFLIYVELWGSTTSDQPVPTNAENIENFPEAYDPSLVKFAPGSFLYYVIDKKLYITDTDNEFQLQ